MKKRTLLTLQQDDNGNFILPRELVEKYGLTGGAAVRIEEGAEGLGSPSLRLSLSSARLARVYVEPTNQCNLDCRTCMRNVWEEPPGRMSAETFAKVLEGIRAISPRPAVFFGGFGEPLSHPQILEMVAQAKATGAPVEMITNGILLDEETAQRLVEIGLDRLWVSLDGATPESYADVRLGAALPQVLENVARLRDLRKLAYAERPRLGIAFVAMRRNAADLPEVIRTGKLLGADVFSISNVLAHTEELRKEVLYGRSFFESDFTPSEWAPLLSLPRMDVEALNVLPLGEMLRNRAALSITRQPLALGANRCPFVEKGSLSVRWDGAVAPCLALLHDHEYYLDDRLRKSKAFAAGNLAERGLLEIWHDPDYTALREKLMDFSFSPCTFCNSCEMADANEEDCFGNTLPACGGCLWAQGFIQCP